MSVCPSCHKPECPAVPAGSGPGGGGNRGNGVTQGTYGNDIRNTNGNCIPGCPNGNAVPINANSTPQGVNGNCVPRCTIENNSPRNPNQNGYSQGANGNCDPRGGSGNGVYGSSAGGKSGNGVYGNSAGGVCVNGSYGNEVDGSVSANGAGDGDECGKGGRSWLFDNDNRLEMAPPPYPDLGKQARDIFSKGYNFGSLKLDVKTKTGTGVEFASGCTSNQDTGKVFGSLETKYKVKEYGLTFSEKWNTDNVLATEIAIQDQIAAGLKISVDGTFAPQTGSKSGHVKSAFANDNCALNCDLDLAAGGPNITASAVLGYQGFVAGYQTKFDTTESKVTANNFALGYSTGDFILHTNVNDGQEFGGSIFHRVNPDLDAAVDLQWSSGSSETRFGIGCRYTLDAEASVRAKVNNASQIGLGYQQKLREGITVTLSTLIDAKNFNQGGHKIGLGLEMEA